MIDQGQSVRERRGDLGRDLELGGIAPLDPDPGDHDAAGVELDLADPAAGDREVHAARREGGAAVDAGQWRHGLVVAQRQIVELEAARDLCLGDRTLVEVAGSKAIVASALGRTPSVMLATTHARASRPAASGQ